MSDPLHELQRRQLSHAPLVSVGRSQWRGRKFTCRRTVNANHADIFRAVNTLGVQGAQQADRDVIPSGKDGRYPWNLRPYILPHVTR